MTINKVINLIHQKKNDGIFGRILKNSSIVFAGNIASALFALLTFALAARGLGVESFGIIVYASTVALITDRLINFQSWQAIIKYGSSTNENEDAPSFSRLARFGFTLDLCSAMIAATSCSIVAIALSHLGVWEASLSALTIIFSIPLAFHVSGTPTGLLRLKNKFTLLAYHQISSALIKFLCTATVYLNDGDIWHYATAWAISEIIGHIILIAFSMKIFLKLPRPSNNKISIVFPGIWGFVWSTNINSSIRTATRELDIVIISATLGYADTGLYKVAKQISAVILKFIDPFYQVIYPELSKLAANKKYMLFLRIGLLSSISAGILSAGIWIIFFTFSNSLIKLTVGEGYLDAIPVTLWYMGAVVVAATSFPLQPAALALGYPTASLIVHIAATIFYFCILFLTIKTSGLIGAGISYLLYYAFWSILLLLTTQYLFRVTRTK